MFIRATSLLSLALFGTAEIEEEKDVMVLTDDNFEEAVNENSNVMVEFYAPWCGHCKNLEPEYAAAAEELKEKNIDAKMGKVDTTVQKALGKKFEVRGFPTIKFFMKGKELDGSGAGRDTKSIVRWIEKKVSPPAAPLESEEDHEKFVAKAKKATVSVVGYFKDQECDLAKELKQVARDDEEREYRTASLELGSVEKDTITVYREFDGGKVSYKDGDLKSFISDAAMPTVIEFSKEADKILSKYDVSFVAIAPRSDEAAWTKQKEAMTNAATEIKKTHECLFVIVDSVEHAGLVKWFNVKENDLPKLAALHQKDQKYLKYMSPEGMKFETEAITAYANDYYAGKLKLHLKAAALPEDWNKNPVKVLTGVNFDEIVNSPDRAIFVEFYGPSCGHCKKLAPIWDELAEKVGADDLMIAKIDSTENELQDVDIQGFPTLKFWPKGADKTIIDYEGGRDLESLTAFVEKQTGKKVAEESDEL